MRFACAEHPRHPGVGVCASCVREKLALCMRSLEEEERAPPTLSCCWDESNMSSVVNSSPDIQKNATLCSMNADGGKQCSAADQKEGQARHLSWLSAKALCKLRCRHPNNLLQLKPNSPNKQDNCTRHGSSPASLAPWLPTPCPSSASSKSPLKLASLHSTPSPASKLPSSTHSTMSPLLLCASQPSAAILSSPLQLPPPKSCRPARRSPALRSALPPANIASLESSRTSHVALSAGEQNWRNGQRVSGAGLRHMKRKVSWVSLVLRKLRLIKRRAQNQEEMESPQLGFSNRTSSATESDLLHHSHAHYNSYSAGNQARGHGRPNSYSYNLRLDRPQKENWREDMKSCMRGYANGYNTSQGLSSFTGLRARHGYKSMSCVQRHDAAELLRFYLPPPSFYSTLTRSYYC